MKRFAFCSLLLMHSLVPVGMAGEALSPAVLDAYYRIADALAADSLQGVAENALAVAKGTKDPALQLSATNVAAATQVDLEKAREIFKTFSSVLANGIKFGDYELPHGTVYRVHCPMVNADWLQVNNEPIRNPYHGSSMLDCGGVTETYSAKK